MSEHENQDSKPKTGRQVALWLQRGRMQLARTEAKEKAKAESAPQTETVQMEAPVIAPRAPIEIKAPTKRSVAAFLWMPQIHLSLQAFTFPLALLVQTFAQILITTGLLRADHPARHYSGAKSFGIMQLLEEARQSLPPLRTLWGNGTRILATRQYAIFASTIGVMVTGTLALLTMFTNVFFGFAKAYAQSNPASLQGMGSFGTSGDLGIGFINAIFDPQNTSVTGGALGELFRIYSSAMLIFAGVILLWIIISAVAETARTGIPFGKQFNHVWAPIRLIVALGLLIPLGAGLNSGQHMVIYLTKWGSEQANDMWVTFANNINISGPANGGGASSGNVIGGLSAIPVAKDSYRAISDQLFDIMLCQEMWNQANQDPAKSLPVVPDAQSILSTDAEGKNIVTVDTNSNQESAAAAKFYTKNYAWKNDQINCGNIQYKTTIPGGSNPEAASAALAKFLETRESAERTELQTFANLSQNLRQNLASAARSAVIDAQGKEVDSQEAQQYLDIQMDPLTTYQQYLGVADAYAEARTTVLGAALSEYNNLLGLDFKEEAETRGWISAPVWLNRIAEQNGKVLDAAQQIPIPLSPNTPLPYVGNNWGPAGNSLIGSPWNLAMQFMGDARKTSNAPVQSNIPSQATALARATFAQILAPNNNPLGTISSYGRSLMGQGVDITFRASAVNEDGRTPATCEQAFGACPAPSSPNEISDKDAIIKGIKTAVKADESEVIGLKPGNDMLSQNQAFQNLLKTTSLGQQSAGVMRPVGTMLISFGFMAGYVLPLLPFFRFMLGVLGWILLLFEALLAVPLLAISLLKTDGEGFMTQNFQTGVIMILALILRPMLMIFGLLLGLMAFNGIMNITSASFLAAANPENDILSMVVYLIIYGMLAYTLANSAFKAIDIVPNQVMSWLGARLDQRVDDASVIHQQSASMVQNLGMVSAMGGGMKVKQQSDEAPR